MSALVTTGAMLAVIGDNHTDFSWQIKFIQSVSIAEVNGALYTRYWDNIIKGENELYNITLPTSEGYFYLEHPYGVMVEGSCDAEYFCYSGDMIEIIHASQLSVEVGDYRFTEYIPITSHTVSASIPIYSNWVSPLYLEHIYSAVPRYNRIRTDTRQV